jgi:hypothetical protein
MTTFPASAASDLSAAPDFVTVRQAAALAHLSTTRILQLVNEGRLPVLKRLNGVGDAYLLARGPVEQYARDRLERLKAQAESTVGGVRYVEMPTREPARRPGRAGGGQ